MSLAADVRHFFTQSPRQLPSRGLYDRLGSALFDAICELPWYPLTRAERRLIVAHRHAIFERASPRRVAELGPGNGSKLHLLLGDDMPHGVERVDLVDVSPAALSDAARRLREGRAITIATHEMRYEEGLDRVLAGTPAGGTLVIFFGSNIGNFDRAGAVAFLRRIRARLRDEDSLLIGADLVRPVKDLLLAYDDPLGVTAAFNKNLLVHLNEVLGASFDVAAFDHRAVWNERDSRIEMHLVSTVSQHVSIPMAGLAITLGAGEAIWTESSYKYTPDGFATLLREAQLTMAQPWIDAESPFLLALARPA